MTKSFGVIGHHNKDGFTGYIVVWNFYSYYGPGLVWPVEVERVIRL